MSEWVEGDATAGERPWIPSDTFATRLAQARQTRGWSVAKAAAQCGIGELSWRNWEREIYKPRNSELMAKKISKGMGVSYRWLVGEKPEPGVEQRSARTFRSRWLDRSRSQPAADADQGELTFGDDPAMVAS